VLGHEIATREEYGSTTVGFVQVLPSKTAAIPVSELALLALANPTATQKLFVAHEIALYSEKVWPRESF
jgi:hypothetical protein